MTKSALVIGTDSCANLGDQAILATILRLLQARGFDELHIRSYRPELVRSRIPQEIEVATLDSMPWTVRDGEHHLRAIARSSLSRGLDLARQKFGLTAPLPTTDVAVFVGGRYLQSPYFGSIWITALTTRQLVRQGVPVILAPQTIGPASSLKEKVAMSLVLKGASHVMARDSRTTGFLEHFDVSGPGSHQTPDVVYASTPAPEPACRQFLRDHDVGVTGKPLVLVADRPLVALAGGASFEESQHLRTLVGVLDKASHDHELAFLSTTYASGSYRRHDPEQGLRVKEMMQNPDQLQVIEREPTADVLIGCYGLADAVLTTRMHPIIMASRMGTPVVSFAYEQKCRGQLEVLGHPEWAFDLGSDPGAVFDMLQRCARNTERLSRELLDRTSELARQVNASFDAGLGLA